MARRLLVQNPNTMKEATNTVYSVVSTLKTKGLLLDGETNDFVKMHDVVRDVAILIAKEEKGFLVKHGVKEWPETEADEEISAISLRFETILELPDELVYPELHTLVLDCTRSTDGYRPNLELSITISDKFFRQTEKLLVLELRNVIMLPLPSSVGELTALRMLYLNRCKLGDITMLKYLKNKLEVLRLQRCDIEALPHEVGELTRLRLLDLGDCPKLEVIPNGVISKLVRLEELHFPLRFNNWEAAKGNEQNSKVSLAELMSLPRVSTLHIHIPYHRLLDIDVLSPNLIRFHIVAGYGMSYAFKEYSRQGVMLIDGRRYDDLNIRECLLGKPKWFNNLTQLLIKDCDSLKYLFTPSSARVLQQLQCLEIRACEILESVIRNEGETEEEIIENVVSFSQLKHLVLENLPCLISFYPWMKKATTGSQYLPSAQGLFNEKVALPALEEISIVDVPTITEIWEMQTFPSPEKAANSSFPRLSTMSVTSCSNLVNVVKGFHNTPVRGTEKEVANYLLQLPQLRSLELNDLERLSSFDEPSLVTQTPSLFNHQVAFHALEELTIVSVPNITEICDKNRLSTKLFGQLRSLKIDDCEKLINVVSSHFLPPVLNMESLEIENCPAMEVIVVLEKRKEETKEATNKDIIEFPKLTELTLGELENLRGFCAYGFEDQLHINMQVVFTADSSCTQLPIKDTSIITERRPLFNHKVAFHALGKLRIVSVQNITEIWDKSVLPTELFGQLRSVKVEDCEKLINVVSSHFLPLVLNMESLKIINCPAMEVIVFLEKRGEETKEGTNKDIIQFPKLTKLKLQDLENLKGFCAYSSEDQLYFNMPVTFTEDSSSTQLQVKDTSIIAETRPLFNHKSAFPALKVLHIEELPRITVIWGMQTFPTPENVAESSSSGTETRPLFNHQVQFSALEELHIDAMPNLTEIWDKNVLPTKLFGQLRSLNVYYCEKLINVFPSHMLQRIQNIEFLDVYQCSKMEVIIILEKREEETKEATKKDIIEFPKLQTLKLKKLEKLKGFCAYKVGGQLYFDVQVAFPKLDRLWSRFDTHSTKIIKEAVSGNKGGPNQESLTKAAIKSLAPDEDDLEDEDEETPKKAGPSKRKPIESATKPSILSEDDKEDEDKETPKKAKVAKRE